MRRVLVLCAALVMQGAMAVGEEAPATRPAQVTWYLMGEEIFANPAAAEKVAEARKVDPMQSGDLAQRDKAAELYSEAIDLQPGAAINAALAERIAQMYTWNDDPAKGIHPDGKKAAIWWKRAHDWADRRTELYQLTIIGGGVEEGPAEKRYQEILDSDEKQLQWPSWKFLPGSAPERVRGKMTDGPLAYAPAPEVSPEYKAAMARVRAHGLELKRIAAERIVMIVKSRHDGEPAGERKAAIAEDLLAWGQKYQGTDIETYFEKAAEDVINPPGKAAPAAPVEKTVEELRAAEKSAAGR